MFYFFNLFTITDCKLHAIYFQLERTSPYPLPTPYNLVLFQTGRQVIFPWHLTQKINYYNGCSVHYMFTFWVSLMSQWIEIDKNGHFLLNLTFFQGYNRVFNQHGKNFY